MKIRDERVCDEETRDGMISDALSHETIGEVIYKVYKNIPLQLLYYTLLWIGMKDVRFLSILCYLEFSPE